MINTVSKLFSIIVAVLLLFIYPLSESYDRQDDVSSMIAFQAVTGFVDAVRDKGYVTPTMYNDFFRVLHSTGNTYDIVMEHEHKRYDPVYVDPSNPATFNKEYRVNYEAFFTPHIMAVLFPDNAKPLDDGSRKYRMAMGDYFTVTIRNTNRTNATLLRNFLSNGDSDRAAIFIPYGGMVRNEND